MKNRTPRSRAGATAAAKRTATLTKLGQEIADLQARLADLAADRAKDPPKKSSKRSSPA